MKKNRNQLDFKRRMRSKTYRKKWKRLRMQIRRRNKHLIQKYPWLKAVSWFSMSPIRDENYDIVSIWDDLPKGWTTAFGRMMCDELDAEFRRLGIENEVYVQQAKEKYGVMRLYLSETEDEIENIIRKYEVISENTCIICGKPDVPCLDDGWVSPWCKKCYSNNKYHNPDKYEEFAPENKDHWKIRESFTTRKYFPENEVYVEHTEDISETANKIRYQYQQRQDNKKRKGERS